MNHGNIFLTEPDDKAGYNQAGEIAKTLSTLRNTFNAAAMHEDFKICLESCRAILNVIAGKVKWKEIEYVDEVLDEVYDELPKALKTYSTGGTIWITNPEQRKDVKKKLEETIRILEKLQDKYGYGMYSSEDPKRAIFKK